MVSPTYVAAFTFDSGTTSTTSIQLVTANLPGLAVGDYILWAMTGNTATVPSAPAGWTVAVAGWGAAGGICVVFGKFADSADVAGFTHNATVVDARWAAPYIALRGVDTTVPLDTAPTTTTTDVCPAITTATSDTLIVALGRGVTSSGITTVAWSSTTGTLRTSGTSQSGTLNNMTAGVATQPQIAAGAVTPTLNAAGTFTKTQRATIALRGGAAAPPSGLVTIVHDFTTDGVLGLLNGQQFGSSSYSWAEHQRPQNTGQAGVVAAQTVVVGGTTYNLPRRMTSLANSGYMYPGIILDKIPRKLIVDFGYDPNGWPGIGNGVHFWASNVSDDPGVPLHFGMRSSQKSVEAGNPLYPGPGQILITSYGKNKDQQGTADPDAVAAWPVAGNVLEAGIIHRVTILHDPATPNTLTFIWPVQSGKATSSYTDDRLEQMYGPGGSGICMPILEIARAAGDPYNYFTRVEIQMDAPVTPPSVNAGGFLPWFG